MFAPFFYNFAFVAVAVAIQFVLSKCILAEFKIRTDSHFRRRT